MTLSSLIIIGICAMLLLALGVILFVILYQRRIIAHQIELKKINEQKEIELIQASLQSEEEERNRIATELHDDVAATLASARFYLYKSKDAVFDEERINQSKALLDESIKKIRDISHKLQPAMLLHLGLEQSLQSLIEPLDKSGTLTTAYRQISSMPRLSENIELSVYRIAQELIANILKHTGASIIELETSITNDSAVLIFIYNGEGLTHERYQELIYKKGSLGLKNIVNRLKAINGSISYYKDVDELYKTELKVPFKLS